jgi:uncharacterized membrane protein YkoI
MKQFIVCLLLMAASPRILNAQTVVVAPPTVLSEFNLKYPSASNIYWYQYQPMPTKPVSTDWYYTMDPSDYYVMFIWNGDDYVAWYDNGKWIRSVNNMETYDLPTAVQSAISNRYPGFTITDVDVEHDKNQRLYEVDLEKGTERWTLFYDNNGTVVKQKAKKYTNATAETAQLTDFQSRFPNATAVNWYIYDPRDPIYVMPSDWDYSMRDNNDYEVHFNVNGIDYIAYYDNGTWIRTATDGMNAAMLPGAVSSAINRDYAGYSIKDVDTEERKNMLLYEVELVRGADKCKIHYTATGEVNKRKCKNSATGMKEKS